MLGVLYIDALQPIFKTVPLGTMDWLVVLIFAGIPTFLMGLGSVLTTSKKSKRPPMKYSSKPITR
jgi:Ca2+-transporting ATPase